MPRPGCSVADVSEDPTRPSIVTGLTAGALAGALVLAVLLPLPVDAPAPCDGPGRAPPLVAISAVTGLATPRRRSPGWRNVIGKARGTTVRGTKWLTVGPRQR